MMPLHRDSASTHTIRLNRNSANFSNTVFRERGQKARHKEKRRQTRQEGRNIYIYIPYKYHAQRPSWQRLPRPCRRQIPTCSMLHCLLIPKLEIILFCGELYSARKRLWLLFGGSKRRTALASSVKRHSIREHAQTETRAARFYRPTNKKATHDAGRQTRYLNGGRDKSPAMCRLAST